MLEAYIFIGIVWYMFVRGLQKDRYEEHQPHVTDNVIEHLLLWPVGLGHYVSSGIITTDSTKRPEAKKEDQDTAS